MKSYSINYVKSNNALLIFIISFIAIYSILQIDNSFIFILRSALTSTYIAVTTFVALTLFIYYISKNFTTTIIAKSNILNKPFMQVTGSALLGALPGCAGAIIVAVQYSKNKLSFGSLVASLTTTMGDAAFLLISVRPKSALLVILLSLTAGIISGLIVDKLNIKPNIKNKNESNKTNAKKLNLLRENFWNPIDTFWFIILIPGILIGILELTTIDANKIFSFIHKDFTNIISTIGISLTIAIFLCSKNDSSPNCIIFNEKSSIKRKVSSESAYISFLVAISFVIYEMLLYVAGWDIKNLFNSYIYIIPLISIIVGFIPGCAPQIIVTTLYINNVIPFSALIGNAISNDGDALFPTISLNPKSAIMATLYTAIPALILAYTIFIFIE